MTFLGEISARDTRRLDNVLLRGFQRLPCVCGLSEGWAEAGGWKGRGYEHGLREAYGRREGACRLYTPVCQAGGALLDHRAMRHEPGKKGYIYSLKRLKMFSLSVCLSSL